MVQHNIHVTSARKDDPLEEPLKFGRPKLQQIFDEAEGVSVRGDNEVRIGVVTCGPSALVTDVWDETSKRTGNKRRFDFHHETFEF